MQKVYIPPNHTNTSGAGCIGGQINGAGLALFESGLLRAKNTLSIFVQIFGGVTVMSLLWVVFGYSLVFGPTQGGVIGNFKYGLLLDVPPLLMTGSFAERFRFWPCMTFMVLWEILVYYPVAHWVWYVYSKPLSHRNFPATERISAMVCALVLGKRKHWHEH
eukprot:gene7073-17375_t